MIGTWCFELIPTFDSNLELVTYGDYQTNLVVKYSIAYSYNIAEDAWERHVMRFNDEEYILYCIVFEFSTC